MTLTYIISNFSPDYRSNLCSDIRKTSYFQVHQFEIYEYFNKLGGKGGGCHFKPKSRDEKHTLWG